MGVSDYPRNHGSLVGLSGTDHHPQYAMDLQGALNVRPAAGRVGRYYYATDTGVMYRDNGFTWTATSLTTGFIDARGDLVVGTGEDTVGRLPVGSNGQVLVADSTQTAGVRWGAATKTYRFPHTVAIPGDVLVPSGDTSYIPGFFVPAPAGQTVSFVGARTRINSGTSATISLQRNGTAIPISAAATTYAVTTTATTITPTTATALSADDMLQLVVTAVSGTPRNMSVSLYLDYTVT